MTRLLTLFLVATSLVGAACSGGPGGDAPPVEPETDDFVLDPDVQDEIDDAADSGAGAEGSYAYDPIAGTLLLNIETSGFRCGVEAGQLSATVVELTPTRLVLRFGDDEDALVTWTRVDEVPAGPTIELTGVWHTDEPSLYLILLEDGTMQLIGEDELCDGEPENREQNSQNCWSMDVDIGADITIDGDFEDWNAIGPGATFEDPVGDYQGDDPGADLKELQVAFSVDKLYVRLDVHDVPSEAFQSRQDPNGGVYRLTVQGDNGLSIFHRVAYSPESQEWVSGDPIEGIEIGVGPAGIEWSVDVSDYLGDGFGGFDLIMVEPMDCGQGTCQPLDAMDCAWFEL